MPFVTKEETYIFCNDTCNLQIQWLAERKALLLLLLFFMNERKALLSIKTVYNYIVTRKISQIHAGLTVG